MYSMSMIEIFPLAVDLRHLFRGLSGEVVTEIRHVGFSSCDRCMAAVFLKTSLDWSGGGGSSAEA